jgi:hypothetical protein
MTRQRLDRKRQGLEAQLHWAEIHGGDQELMDVLCDESDRLSGMLVDQAHALRHHSDIRLL